MLLYKESGQNLNLESFSIHLICMNMSDIFANKKSTLKAILNRKEYSSLKSRSELINVDKNQSIGRLLVDLKLNKKSIYCEFLNKYGDQKYCQFSVIDAPSKSGIYFINVDGDFKYVGRCGKTNFKKRFYDYGKISPTNVFKHGQSTNCRINNLINEAITNKQIIVIGLYPMDNIQEIERLEKEILKNGNFDWNIQKR